jgi:TPR repeat protein
MEGDLGFATRDRILRSPTKHRAPLRECQVNVPAHPPCQHNEQSRQKEARLEKELNQDFQKTVKEAEAGNVRSQKLMGTFYSRMGDFGKAVVWYWKACEQGYRDAQCEVGTFFALRKGVSINWRSALLNWE